MPPMLSISPGNVDLWLCFYDRITEPRVLLDMAALLSPHEQAQERRFVFPDDRQRYRATRALVRTVLSSYVPEVAPGEWQFVANAYGRPEIAAPRGAAAALRFNISHARGLIVLAVGQGCEVGVDVEHVTARAVSLDIAHHYFSAVESADLAAVAPELQQDRFFEYWTFKEAYIKARGMGLSLPLDQFSMHFPSPATVALSMAPELGDNPSRWWLAQYRPTPVHQLAVCLERLGGALPQVALREAVPTVTTRPFHAHRHRSSTAPA